MTLNGDIGKTFSGLKNLAVLQGFFAKIRKRIGDYKPLFLTTPGAERRAAEKSGETEVEGAGAEVQGRAGQRNCSHLAYGLPART